MIKFNTDRLDAAASIDKPIIIDNYKISCWEHVSQLKQDEFDCEEHKNTPAEDQWATVDDVELSDSTLEFGIYYSIAVVEIDTGLRRAEYAINTYGLNTSNTGFGDDEIHDAIIKAGLKGDMT